MHFLFVTFSSILIQILSADSNIEILPEGCDCRDWYGACRKQSELWTDDNTWDYECKGTESADSTFVGCQGVGGVKVPSGSNETIDGLWHSCEQDNTRLRYEYEPFCTVDNTVRHVGEEFRVGTFQWICLDTGRWVTGCYYQNETKHDVLLQIGETGYNGLIKHVCDRFKDYPGRVQYYAEVRDDIPVKHPSNKGINQNFPEAKVDLFNGKVERWLHENSESFVANDEEVRVRVRYLPASRREWN